MFDVAIGALIYNDVLTMTTRQGEELGAPVQHQLGTPLDAVALLLDERARRRHDDPIIFLEAGSTAGAVLDGIRKIDEHSRDQIVNGLSPAGSAAGAGVGFYDRRSELHYRFCMRVSQGKLFVPAIYNEQIAAFSETTKDGKVFFPYVADVAAKLGRFPAFAVAAVLAAIDVPFRSSASKRNHNPYEKASLARGHDVHARR